MELLTTIGEFFASAFAWVAGLVSNGWVALVQSSFVQGLAAVLGSGLAKALVGAALVMLVAAVLHASGIIGDNVFKFFVAVFLLVVAIAVVTAVLKGEYWVAMMVVILAVLTLAASASVDPATMSVVNEVLAEAGTLIGSVLTSALDAVGSFAAPLMPWLLAAGGVFLLTRGSKTQKEIYVK